MNSYRRITRLAFTILSSCWIAAPVWAQTDVRDVVHELDELVVSATRTERRVGDLPVNVTVVTPEDLRLSAANSVGDFLKTVPGFNMARAFSTLTSHPASQSVSMRGLGGSAASRTLVLIDGVPLNDAFAGWVHWSRVPLENVARIEVVRGGGAGIWGSRAFGGVINIITKRAVRSEANFSIQGGGLGTVKSTAGATYRVRDLGVSLTGEYLSTNGYIPVRPDLRGPVDTRSTSSHYTLRGRAEYAIGGRVALLVDGGYFTEDRETGTAFRGAALSVATLRARASANTADGSAWSVSLFGSRNDYETQFSSVPQDRASERPATDQYDVPARDVGAAFQWAKGLDAGHELTAGVDVTRVAGETNELYSWSGTEFRNYRNAGGTQVLAGWYLQDAIDVGEDLDVVVGSRLNLTRNTDGFHQESSVATGDVSRDEAFEDGSQWRFNVSGGFRYRAGGRASWRGSVHTGFRAPTVFELYKPYRSSGNVSVAPNHELIPERMVGGELGLDLRISDRVTARWTGFYSRVSDAIIDATIAVVETSQVVEPCGFVSAGGTCVEHQNVGVLRSVGIESELHVSPAEFWTMSLSHLFNPTEFLEAEGRPALVGLQAPQTPRQQMSVRAAYAVPGSWSTAVTARWSSRAYDDDLNQNELESHLVLDARVSRQLTGRASAFVSGENLLDNEYAVGRTGSGLVRIGLPRLVQVGVRLSS